MLPILCSCKYTNIVWLMIVHFQAKHLQFVSGVNATSYWLATFAWDMVNSLPLIILIIIAFAAFNENGFRGENLAAIFLLLVSPRHL